TLSNVTSAMKYSVNGGSAWNDITGTTADLTGKTVTVANDIKVYQPGNGATTADSDVQTIDITKGATPACGVVQPTKDAPTGSITGLNNTMEYRTTSDGAFTPATGDIIDIPASTTYQIRTKAVGNVLASDIQSITITAYVPPTPSTGGDYTPPKKPIIVDGNSQNISTEKKNGGTTVITIDQSKLSNLIGNANDNSSVVVPVSRSTTATASLMVKNVEDMAKKNMTLSVKTGGITYDLPTASMDMAALAAAFPGQDTAKIPFEVTIKASDVKVEGATVVVKPAEFTVSALYDGKRTTVDLFSAFVDRTFEITKAESEKISTAVVVESDGTLRHVPTFVFQKDGKYYATVKSMTNSVYALIQNEVTFADAAGKWYEAVANEVGSRKIVVGTDKGTFNGDAQITRAEYATMMVRALGLPQSKTNPFTDVAATAWYAGCVATASEYGVVKGIGDGKFNPEGLITRQEAMQMIYNASKLTGFPKLLNARNLSAEFSDFATVDQWAAEAVTWCLNNNLSVNLKDMVAPTEQITRGEMSAMILCLLQRSELVDIRTKA
ncbi:MAG: S-layer homology domain-containing protein, partial [Oscillospiraceae bacterium]